MSLTVVLGLLAVAAALASIGVGVRIAHALRARGIDANPAMVRWMLFKYMAEYKRVTIAETGTVGSLYRTCSTMLTVTLVLAIAAIVVQVV